MIADPATVAATLGLDAADPAVLAAVAAADAVVRHWYGTAWDDVAADTDPDRAQARTTAANTVAVDVYRRPTTPGGYFAVADYVGRLSRDPTSPVAALLAAGGPRAWGVA